MRLHCERKGVDKIDHLACKYWCVLQGSEFKSINWLPTKIRFEQCIVANIYNFFNNSAPTYISEMYHPSKQSHLTQTSMHKLELPNQTTNCALCSLLYKGPRLWKSLSSTIKSVGTVNTFKHKIIEMFFTDLQKKEDSPYIYY